MVSVFFSIHSAQTMDSMDWIDINSLPGKSALLMPLILSPMLRMLRSNNFKQKFLLTATGREHHLKTATRLVMVRTLKISKSTSSSACWPTNPTRPHNQLSTQSKKLLHSLRKNMLLFKLNKRLRQATPDWLMRDQLTP